MTTAIANRPETDTMSSANGSPRPPDPARQLERTTAAVRVSFTWFGTRKSLNKEQREQIGAQFHAETASIGANKKLLDTKHHAYKALTALKTEIQAYWHDRSLPFPEPGIRLIKTETVPVFNDQMGLYRERLADAVLTLDQHYGQIREEARHRLGHLYDPGDYPPSLDGLFAVAWDFPNVEPPSYLMELRPDIYEQERARVASQFDEAVRLAEESFLAEFHEHIAHLCERITQTSDGGAKVFRNSAVTNLTEFFARFGALNVRSNDQLTELVNHAQNAIRGVGAQRLRDSPMTRASVRDALGRIENELEGMMEVRPRRRIIRDTQENQG